MSTATRVGAGAAAPPGVAAERPCPLCQMTSEPAFTVRDRNRAISDAPFHYRRCRACGTSFLANPPADLGCYYPEDYYVLPTKAALLRAAGGEAEKLGMLEPWAAAGPLIEIGAGLGVFACAAKHAGYDVTAIEMDARCCRYLQGVVGVRAICSDAPAQVLSRLPPARAIVLWHVLEHLSYPWETLAAAAATLEAGGVLALAMPNPESLQMRALGSRWAHIDAPRHLFLIPLPALRARAESLGLALARSTTSDAAGRHWNWFGWEYALRRAPAVHPSTPLTRAAARLLALSLAPIERRGFNGATYTAVFVKR